MKLLSVLPPPQVRDSLEKVRERMYGQFGGMQQSMQKLTQDIKVPRVCGRPKTTIFNETMKKKNDRVPCTSSGSQCTPAESGVRGEGQDISHGEL